MSVVEARALSIIVPAFNEEGNIRAACESVAQTAREHLQDYEILVFDDGSTDRTADIVKELSKNNPHVFLFQNPKNSGLGYNYRIGLTKARYPYAVMIPGDNEITEESLANLFCEVGTKDLVLGYPANASIRPFLRRLISNTFVTGLNFLFDLRVRYYNGPNIVRADVARRFVPQTASFAYMALIVIQSIKAGCSYREAPFFLRPRDHGVTKAFRFKNVVGVLRDIFGLFLKRFD